MAKVERQRFWESIQVLCEPECLNWEYLSAEPLNTNKAGRRNFCFRERLNREIAISEAGGKKPVEGFRRFRFDENPLVGDRMLKADG